MKNLSNGPSLYICGARTAARLLECYTVAAVSLLKAARPGWLRKAGEDERSFGVELTRPRALPSFPRRGQAWALQGNLQLPWRLVYMCV